MGGRGSEHCFAHLGGLGADLGGQKIYLGRYDIITSYAPLSACEWGRDGMDWVGSLWMTSSIIRSIIRTLSTMAVGCSFSLLGPLGALFFTYKNTFG